MYNVGCILSLIHTMYIPYSRKFWRGIKFGGLAVNLCNRQIKIRQYFILVYIHVAIRYRTAKFKSANSFAMAIWGPTAKFNSRQYFPLYSTFGESIYLIHAYRKGASHTFPGWQECIAYTVLLKILLHLIFAQVLEANIQHSICAHIP